ncbi:MAG TPA: histidine kinase dimerization/phospho-acceptor domain-containing protein, partial [Longimicrobiaceae bacterium]
MSAIHPWPAGGGEMRESEERLRLALDIAGLGTWAWDLATGDGDLDERGAEIVGLPPGTLGSVAEAQLASIHPDDLARIEGEVAAGIAGGGAFSLAYRTLHPDGSVHHVASRARVLADEEGRPVRLVGTNRDVTAVHRAQEALRTSEARLRASEARYRAIVEQGPAALAVLEGPDHVCTLVSPAYEAWAGVGPLSGRAFLDALPGMRGSAFDRAHREVYATGESLTVHEAPVADGVFTVHYTALRDAAGAVYAVASLVVDVTEQVRARREVELAREAAEAARGEAEAANRSKGEFLAVMSHELRTPLNAIGGYAEIMEMGIRGPITPEQREDLRRVQTSQRHLLGLINEVLNYAKL